MTIWSASNIYHRLSLCSIRMCANDRVYYGSMVVLVCLHITLPHYHHYTDVSESIGLVKYLTDTFCIVCVSEKVNSLNYMSCNVWGCQYSAYPCLVDDCENMCTLSDYCHQIERVMPLPLCVRSWNNGMGCVSSYILISIPYTLYDDNYNKLQLPFAILRSFWYRSWDMA